MNENKALDKWIMARLHSVIGEVTDALDVYEVDKAIRPIGDFADDLSNWYLRRSRDRFKGADKESAQKILKDVLFVFSRLLAPFSPFVAEQVYKEIGGAKESVHLENWPEMQKISKEDEKILQDMKKVRDAISAGLALRLKAGIKVRQPLSFFETPNKFDEEFLVLIKDELNVKETKVGKDYKLDTKITQELAEEGRVRELTRQIQGHRKKLGLRPGEKATILIFADEEGKNFINHHRNVLISLNIKNFEFTKNPEANVLSYLYN